MYIFNRGQHVHVILTGSPPLEFPVTMLTFPVFVYTIVSKTESNFLHVKLRS